MGETITNHPFGNTEYLVHHLQKWWCGVLAIPRALKIHENPLRPWPGGSPAGPEGPSPSARRSGPAWASRARSASTWWAQPPSRTSAPRASMVERLSRGAYRKVSADDFHIAYNHKISSNIHIPYTTIFSVAFCLSVFCGVHGGAVRLNCPSSFFVTITSPGLVTSILSPMVHSTMRPVSRTNHGNGRDQEQGAHVVPRSHVHIHHGIFI